MAAASESSGLTRVSPHRLELSPYIKAESTLCYERIATAINIIGFLGLLTCVILPNYLPDMDYLGWVGFGGRFFLVIPQLYFINKAHRLQASNRALAIYKKMVSNQSREVRVAENSLGNMKPIDERLRADIRFRKERLMSHPETKWIVHCVQKYDLAIDSVESTVKLRLAAARAGISAEECFPIRAIATRYRRETTGAKEKLRALFNTQSDQEPLSLRAQKIADNYQTAISVLKRKAYETHHPLFKELIGTTPVFQRDNKKYRAIPQSPSPSPHDFEAQLAQLTPINPFIEPLKKAGDLERVKQIDQAASCAEKWRALKAAFWPAPPELFPFQKGNSDRLQPIHRLLRQADQTHRWSYFAYEVAIRILPTLGMIIASVYYFHEPWFFPTCVTMIMVQFALSSVANAKMAKIYKRISILKFAEFLYQRGIELHRALTVSRQVHQVGFKQKVKQQINMDLPYQSAMKSLETQLREDLQKYRNERDREERGSLKRELLKARISLIKFKLAPFDFGSKTLEQEYKLQARVNRRLQRLQGGAAV